MTDTDTTPQTSPDKTDRQTVLSNLASKLQKSREASKLSLEEAAYKLKIRSIYLEALETGNWENMPEDVYALGFLRQYATFLQEDIDTEISQLKSKAVKLTRPLTFPDPSISPNKSWVIIAMLAFIVLFILFNVFNDGEPSPEPPVVQTETSNINAPTPQETIVTTPSKQAEEVTTEATAITPPPSPAVTLEPTSPPTAPIQSGKHHYRLHATDADVWLQLSTPKNLNSPRKLIREVLLKPGEYFSLHHDAPYLLLNCGNIMALEIQVDGKIIKAPQNLDINQKVLWNFALHSTESMPKNR